MIQDSKHLTLELHRRHQPHFHLLCHIFAESTQVSRVLISTVSSMVFVAGKRAGREQSKWILKPANSSVPPTLLGSRSAVLLLFPKNTGMFRDSIATERQHRYRMGLQLNIRGQNQCEQRGKNKHSPTGASEEPARLGGAVLYLRGS